MQIEVVEVLLDDLRDVDIYDYIHGLRTNRLRLLRLRHTKLRWTSFVVCAPRNHALGMQDCLMTDVLWRWRLATYKSEKVRNAFVAEHSTRRLSVARIPDGLYAYASADASEPKTSRVGTSARALEGFWFGAYYVPRENECEELFVARVQRAVDELGWYFVRPFPDAKVDQEEDLLRYSKRLDRVLFDIIEGPSGLNGVRKTLAQIVKLCEAGQQLDRESLALCVTYYGRCLFPYGSEHSEVVASLRARLLRLLGWPTFYAWSVKGLADIERRGKEPKKKEAAPFDTIAELSMYLNDCRNKYPVLSDDPFEPVWKARKLPMQEDAMLAEP